MDSTSVSSIIGFVLFGLSEVLSLTNLNANGIVHSVLLGVGKSFKQVPGYVNLANDTIKNCPDILNIVNKLSSDPELLEIVKRVTGSISQAHLTSIIINNPDLVNSLTNTFKSPEIQGIIGNLITNQELVKQVVQFIKTQPGPHQV